MPHHRVTPGTVRKSLVWLLMVALAVLGLTITQRQVLGSLHTHAESRSVPSFSESTVSSLANDWKSRLQRQQLLGHGQLVLGSPADTSWPAVTARGAHVHGHDSLERHHHAPHDDTLVANDGAAEVVNAVESPATGASVLLPAVGTPNDALNLLTIDNATGAWPTAGFAALVSRTLPPPLRPPTA